MVFELVYKWKDVDGYNTLVSFCIFLSLSFKVIKCKKYYVI